MSEPLVPSRPDGAGPLQGRIPALYTPFIRLLWPYVVEAATAYQVSARLLLTLCWIESGFEPDALAPDGGQGLLSMPPALAGRLARELGMPTPDLQYPQVALRLGAYRLAILCQEFPRISMVLLAWRLGPETVREQPELLAHADHTRFLKRALLTLAWLAEARPWRPVARDTPSSLHAYRTLSRRLPADGPGEVA